MYLHDCLLEIEIELRGLVRKLNDLADRLDDDASARTLCGHVAEIEGWLARAERARVVGPLLDRAVP